MPLLPGFQWRWCFYFTCSGKEFWDEWRGGLLKARCSSCLVNRAIITMASCNFAIIPQTNAADGFLLMIIH